MLRSSKRNRFRIFLLVASIYYIVVLLVVLLFLLLHDADVDDDDHAADLMMMVAVKKLNTMLRTIRPKAMIQKCIIFSINIPTSGMSCNDNNILWVLL